MSHTNAQFPAIEAKAHIYIKLLEHYLHIISPISYTFSNKKRIAILNTVYTHLILIN